METKRKIVHFRKGKESNGWVPIWLVDDQGEQVNTEPVCTVPVEFHGWFPDWLELQNAVLDR